MIEKHPFAPFVPLQSRILILGSFPGRESTQAKRENDWFYCANRNQFWKIIESVYDQVLVTSSAKQDLFKQRNIAITDIIESCERRNNKNSDDNLINKVYNKNSIAKIITQNPIKKILFTSKSVYLEFLENFDKPNGVELVILPSPSPVFRRMNLDDKIKAYKSQLLES
jgi:hypoxanthine-DNA glycosylase